MADNGQLKWVEIKDFTKGLWNGQDYLIPQDAFQTMEDCYPRLEGGIRAFWKPGTTTLTTTGIDDVSVERIMWISPIVTATGVAHLLLTKHITTGQQKGYFADVGVTTWTKQKTFTAIGSGYANGAISQVCTYHDNTNGRNVWIVSTSHNKSDGSEDGWWLVRWDTNSWTRINATALLNATAIQYQARIVGSQLNTIWWTDPGTITTPAASNFLTIQSGNNDVRDIITAMIPYSPSNLLVATAGSGWWNIDGDITNPIVRQMGSDHNAAMNQKIVVTQTGVVFHEPESGIFQTANLAAQFDNLDPQLVPVTFDTMMGLGYQNGFLFAPGGRVLDTETNAWFTLADAATSYSAFELPLGSVNGLPLNRSVIVPQWQASPSILFYNLAERNGSRAEVYTVKTAPLQSGLGKQAVIREVEVMVDSFHAASTVEVTVAGDTRTSNAIPVGTNVIRFTFNKRAEYLDVQVRPKSNHTGSEAPVIEEFRVGFRNDGHNVRLL